MLDRLVSSYPCLVLVSLSAEYNICERGRPNWTFFQVPHPRFKCEARLKSFSKRCRLSVRSATKTLGLTTLSIMTCSIKTPSFMTLSLATLNIMTLHITTLRITKLSTTTLSKTIQHDDTQQKSKYKKL